ncbi:MAG: Crp/Fnr family transcriptional regulator, partial [Bacteroidales bacterium]
MIKVLEKSPIFKGLSGVQISDLISRMHYSLHNYKKGDLIVSRNSRCNSLYIVIQGQCRADIVDDSGKLIKIDSIGEGNYLAPAFVFADANYFPVDVTAASDVCIMEVGKDTLIRLLQENAHLLINFLRIISNRSQFLQQKLSFHMFKTIRSKLAIFIRTESEDFKLDTIHLMQSQQELADFFGVTRQALARTLSDLTKEGIIAFDNKHITV